jgi:hypothetical protein
MNLLLSMSAFTLAMSISPGPVNCWRSEPPDYAAVSLSRHRLIEHGRCC